MHYHAMTRMVAFLQPPTGCPIHVYVASNNLDLNCPPWPPREPSPEESERLEKIKGIQSRIICQTDTGSKVDVTKIDIATVLAPLGPGWIHEMDTYKIAVITMDQEMK